MKLEDKFFKSFFYPFLLAIFLSTLAVTIFLYISTSNNFDKKSSQNIIKYFNNNYANENTSWS